MFNDMILHFSDEYDKYINQIRSESERIIATIVQQELEKERTDKPIKMQRQKMVEIYPHLDTLCCGNISSLINALNEEI